MSERLFDEDDVMTQWIRPDPQGFTLRTRYKGTQEILARNHLARSEAPRRFSQDGVEFHHVCSVPIEVYDMLHRKLGRPPEASELVKLSQDRDFCKLKTREVKL